MSLLPSFRCCSSGLAVVMALSVGAVADVLPGGLPTPPFPLPSVEAFAKERHIPLASIETPIVRAARPGDLAVLLITVFEGATQKQWLLKTTVADLRPEEKPAKAPPKTVLYVTTGTRLEFTYSPVALTLETYGPFLASTPPQAVHTTTARSIVNADDLQLGFDAACRFMLRMSENRERDHDQRPFGIGFQTDPYPAAVISDTQPRAKELGVTPEDERALAGSVPALLGFFQIAQTTAGLREVVWEIIDLPSAWSVIKRGGRVDPFFNFNNEALARLSDSSENLHRFVFGLTLQLNGKPALKTRLVVTTPRPPLLTTAGILEIHAEHPTKADKHAVIQVVAARLARETP